jgi:hypothetical protein
MRSLSKKTITKKSERFLLNPITYNLDEEGKLRKKDNFEEASMLILDFDNGYLSPQDFVKLFWDEAGSYQKRSFIICNTFRRSKEQPNRFRVFLPYIKPAKSLEEHQAVYSSIVRRLEQNGFSKDSTKIDDSAVNGTQPFFAPATNREHPDGHLFIAKGFSKKDISRYAIDPETYLRTAISELPKPLIIEVVDNPTSNSPEASIKKDEIKSDYLMIPKGIGQRNSGFFTAGRRLSRFESLVEVQADLQELAGSDPKMVGRIKGVMKSLSKQR